MVRPICTPFFGHLLIIFLPFFSGLMEISTPNGPFGFIETQAIIESTTLHLFNTTPRYRTFWSYGRLRVPCQTVGHHHLHVLYLGEHHMLIF